MKIIAENIKEKKEILRLSRYLHDFRIYLSNKRTIVYNGNGIKKDVNKMAILKIGDSWSLDLDSKTGNYLRHVYLTPELIDIERKE